MGASPTAFHFLGLELDSHLPEMKIGRHLFCCDVGATVWLVMWLVVLWLAAFTTH